LTDRLPPNQSKSGYNLAPVEITNVEEISKEQTTKIADATVRTASGCIYNDDVDTFQRLYIEHEENIIANCCDPHDDVNILLAALSRHGDNKVAMFLLNQREIIELIGLVKPKETEHSTRLTMGCVFTAADNTNKAVIDGLVDRSRAAIRRSVPSDAGHFVTLYLLHVMGRCQCQTTNSCAHRDVLSRYFSHLMIAARTGDVQLVKQLISDKGGKELVNKPCAEGLTALHIAACYGHQKVVKVLLKSGADIYSNDGGAVYNAIHLATIAGHLHTAKKLLSVDMNGVEDQRVRVIVLNVLHVASAVGQTSVIDKLMIDIDGKQLLNAKNSKGETALMVAARAGHIKTVEYLLSLGAIWNEKDNDDFTVLHWAALAKHDVVPIILNAIKHQTSSVEHYNSTVLKLIVTQDKLGRTVVHMASNAGKTKTVNKLMQLVSELSGMDDAMVRNTRVNALLGAAAGGHNDIIRNVIQGSNIASIVSEKVSQLTAMMYATDAGHLSTVQLLLSRGASWLDRGIDQ